MHGSTGVSSSHLTLMHLNALLERVRNADFFWGVAIFSMHLIAFSNICQIG